MSRDFKDGFKSGDKLMIGEGEAKRQKAPKTKPKLDLPHWWLAKDEDLPQAVLSHIQALIKNDRARIDLIHLATRLYGTNPSNSAQTLQPYLGTPQMANARSPAQYQRMGFNLIQSGIDTLVAKIVKNKPMPFFLTSKGDSKLQRKAKGLNQFVKGVFYENDAYNVGRRAMRDGCVWPGGIVQVYREHGRIRYQRVMPEEILVDYVESHYGQESAKTIHRVRIVDRMTLAALWPDHAEAIMQMLPVAQAASGSATSVGDSVAVAESWRLPSAPGADDGVHCISAGTLLLSKEPWKRMKFPFAVFRFSENLAGFWGQSATEQLIPIQLELNRNLRLIQQATYMMGAFKILVHNGSQIVDTHFDNRVGTQIKWSGTVPPEYVAPAAIPPEVYQNVKDLKQMGFEQLGISQLSANSQKPAGLDSGEAQRVYHDIETERFQVVGQAYEDFYLQLADLSVMEARELYEEMKAEGKELTFKVPGKKFLDTIDWADVNMEEDQYSLQCYPISKLPSDPAGRLQTVQELIQGGFVSQDVGNRLLDFPDIDAEQTLQNAMLDYLHMALDDISEGGEYRAPEPDDNLQMALKLAVEYLTVGKRDNLPQQRLDDLRTYISQVNQLITTATPPAPMGGPAPGGQAGPGGAPALPEPTPTSNLIPNGAA